MILAQLVQDGEMSSDGEEARRIDPDEEPVAKAISHTSKEGWPGATKLDMSKVGYKPRADYSNKNAGGKKFRRFSGGKEAQGRTYVQCSRRGRRKGALPVRQW